VLTVGAAPNTHGGGAMEPWELVALSALAAAAHRRRRVAFRERE
jgi:MYXO-CTERM domain-containing protein